MIFVTVGNWHKGYDRLVEAVDNLIEKGIIQEEVLVQIGNGTYRPQKAEWFEYCSPEQCEEYVLKSRVVISHAGMGTVSLAVRLGKPIIVVPRKKKLGEIYDDHQFCTARQLAQENKALVAYDIQEIPERLQEADSFIPAKTETSSELVKAIEEYLEMLQSEKSKK